MWPFTTKYTLADSGIMQDFTDWHSHLLPGVDDGVKSLDTTLEILREYERLGVRKAWFTPHVMEDVSNHPTFLQERFEEVKKAYDGPVQIELAAENMLDNLFDERIKDKAVLPIGVQGNHLLVETSYFTPPYDFDDKIESVRKAGFFPLLAHPERYVYMTERDYDQLLANEVKMQLNIYSLLGMYGPEAREKALYLLSKDAYWAIGTDTHRLSQLQAALTTKALKKKEIEAVLKIKERMA